MAEKEQIAALQKEIAELKKQLANVTAVKDILIDLIDEDQLQEFEDICNENGL